MGSHEYSGEVVELAVKKHVTTPFTREIGVCDHPTMSIALWRRVKPNWVMSAFILKPNASRPQDTQICAADCSYVDRGYILTFRSVPWSRTGGVRSRICRLKFNLWRLMISLKHQQSLLQLYPGPTHEKSDGSGGVSY